MINMDKEIEKSAVPTKREMEEALGEKKVKTIKKSKKISKGKVKPKISKKKKVVKKISKKKIKQRKPLKSFNSKTIKIEAEFDDGETEVEIKTPEERIEFTLNTTNKKIVLSEISKRTGISINKLNKIVVFEEDD